MKNEFVKMELAPIAPRWWALVIRGLAAIAFGVVALVRPGAGLLALVVLWGAYAIVDGVFSIVLAIRGAKIVPGWGWLLAEGIVGVAAGVVTFLWPGITALALLVVIAAWAILTGIAEIATAIQLRKVLKGEWMLVLSGILSIAFGVLAAMMPGAGALAVTYTIGIYAILFGALLIGLGVRLHRFVEMVEHPAHA